MMSRYPNLGVERRLSCHTAAKRSEGRKHVSDEMFRFLFFFFFVCCQVWQLPESARALRQLPRQCRFQGTPLFFSKGRQRCPFLLMTSTTSTAPSPQLKTERWPLLLFLQCLQCCFVGFLLLRSRDQFNHAFLYLTKSEPEQYGARQIHPHYATRRVCSCRRVDARHPCW